MASYTRKCASSVTFLYSTSSRNHLYPPGAENTRSQLTADNRLFKTAKLRKCGASSPLFHLHCIMLNDWGTFFENVIYKILHKLTVHIPVDNSTYKDSIHRND